MAFYYICKLLGRSQIPEGAVKEVAVGGGGALSVVYVRGAGGAVGFVVEGFVVLIGVEVKDALAAVV
ncbi:hypothetical protein H5410_042656 [Solanum commersonii]|uniref:Uncharacterized protein n=1 Tax=Solanum commersonii TaxID=4109 RepID=A0A9J5XZ87_SOLCO|nr:hypothetical protein H5410_042656 [Solanum commersonii]